MNEATFENLRRKSAFVDVVQPDTVGRPLPSVLDLNLTELCNRACVFCPRVDPAGYPNQALHMPLALVQRIADQLEDAAWRGVIILSGFGEPMLHPSLGAVVKILAGAGCRVELVTNGDRLTTEAISRLADLGLAYTVVSLYDGPHQLEDFHARFAHAGMREYLLRDRWHTAADAFGLKLTNRAGTVTVGEQDPIWPGQPCLYLAYQLTVDWNGDVLLCVQDWHKRVKFGNLGYQTMSEVWNSPALHRRRLQLMSGNRGMAPCSGCNTNGTLHGHNHAAVWGKSPVSQASSPLVTEDTA